MSFRQGAAFITPVALRISRFQPYVTGHQHSGLRAQRDKQTRIRARMMTTGRRQSARELVNDVLTHWFGSTEVGRYDTLEPQFKLWYEGGEEIDRDIRSRFGADVEGAIEGKWDLLEDTSEYPVTGPLALVIMLDQYTRNIFRGSAKAFDGDDKCIQVAEKIVKSGRWTQAKEQLSAPQLMSFLLPFMHQESLQHLDICMEKVSELVEDSKAAGKKAEKVTKSMEMSLDFAKKHRDILHEFGRYPHRNEVLGRESTPEELEFLEDGPRFGQ